MSPDHWPAAHHRFPSGAATETDAFLAQRARSALSALRPGFAPKSKATASHRGRRVLLASAIGAGVLLGWMVGSELAGRRGARVAGRAQAAIEPVFTQE